MIDTQTTGPTADVGPADFSAWVAPHQLYMRVLAMRLTDVSTADDVVSEALELAWRKRARFDPSRGSPRAWLLALTADRARKSRRKRRDEPVPMEQLASVAAADSAADLDLRVAVTKLTRRQRLAVELYYFVGLPVSEVAEAMSCSPGTVKSTLSDARARLRTLLGEDQ